METDTSSAVGEVKSNLIEVGGRTTQELGLGRILGQVLGYVYLSDHECSLDEICEELSLSKAAVSIAARQLETLGLLQRAWKPGDRRSYYKVVSHFGVALKKGLLGMLRTKIDYVGEVLDDAAERLDGEIKTGAEGEAKHIKKRVDRARRLRKRVNQLLDSPLIKLLGN